MKQFSFSSLISLLFSEYKWELSHVKARISTVRHPQELSDQNKQCCIRYPSTEKWLQKGGAAEMVSRYLYIR